MRRRRCRPLVWGTVLVAVGWSAGCSHHVSGKAIPEPGAAGSAGSVSPEAIGISPAGVTTRVDVPANSTEEEYFQACHAAKQWMDARPKTGESPLEPYLAMVQTSSSGSAGTWNRRWADLTPARQAAVIIAARAAANGECG